MKSPDPFAKKIRLAARIIGCLFVAFTLFMAIGYYIEGQNKNDPTPLSAVITILFIVWGISLGGLILALWKEGTGGIISLAGFILIPFVNLFNDESPTKAAPFIIFLFFMIPSILYIQYWRLTKNKSQNKVNKDPADI